MPKGTMSELYTTFRLLHKAEACEARYRHLAEALGGIEAYGRDTPIPLSKILEANGLDDALWSLRATAPEQEAQRDRLSRLLACDYAERVLPIYEEQYPGDTRVRDCIATARRYAGGGATDKERATAGATAGDAALDAAAAAALDAAAAAAWSAMDAVWAAWYAAKAVVGASNVERQWQEARLLQYLLGEVDYE